MRTVTIPVEEYQKLVKESAKIEILRRSIKPERSYIDNDIVKAILGDPEKVYIVEEEDF